MIKNKHANWAACLSPSIFMRRCLLSPSFMASQRQQVNSCAFRVPAGRCAICVMRLSTFSQMCPCSLLMCAHVTLGGAPFVRPQYGYAMSNTPYHGLIQLCTYFFMLVHLFSPAPFVVCHTFCINSNFLSFRRPRCGCQ